MLSYNATGVTLVLLFEILYYNVHKNRTRVLVHVNHSTYMQWAKAHPAQP